MNGNGMGMWRVMGSLPPESLESGRNWRRNKTLCILAKSAMRATWLAEDAHDGIEVHSVVYLGKVDIQDGPLNAA